MAYGGTSAILPILAESELRPRQYQLMSASAFVVTSSGAATLPAGSYILSLTGHTDGSCDEGDPTNWTNTYLSWNVLPA